MQKKKAMLMAFMTLVAVLCCFAETHTITIVSRVEKQEPRFIIVNPETGDAGASVVYTTGEISRRDVTTSFDIVQCTDCNGKNAVALSVSATELTAKANHMVYSTDGVSIIMDGQSFGSTVSFTRITECAIPAGTTVASFEVIWPTGANLIDAVYEACVTLTTTVL